MHRQSDLISSCTALMRGQRKLIKRCSPLGNTLDCNTSTGLHTPTRNKSGAPHKGGLSSSRPAQSAWEEWMLFSAWKGSCCVPHSHQGTSRQQHQMNTFLYIFSKGSWWKWQRWQGLGFLVNWQSFVGKLIFTMGPQPKSTATDCSWRKGRSIFNQPFKEMVAWNSWKKTIRGALEH